MALPEDYLTYPHRSYGMDQTLYPWRPATERSKIVWPDGKTAAAMIVVPLEFHRLNPQGKPFKHPGAMQTTYPDLRHRRYLFARALDWLSSRFSEAGSVSAPAGLMS